MKDALKGFAHGSLLVIALAGAFGSYRQLVRVRESIAEAKDGKPKHNSFFHAPPEGCPAGTTLFPKMFELDDKPVAGCYNPKGDGTFDVLRGGEEMHIGVEIEIPRDLVEPGRKDGATRI